MKKLILFIGIVVFIVVAAAVVYNNDDPDTLATRNEMIGNALKVV